MDGESQLDWIVRLAVKGLKTSQITALIALKERVQEGEVNEETTESMRLLFGRWLVQHQRLSDGD